MIKRYKARIKYKEKMFIMPVAGEDEESVIKQITDFYIKLFEDKKNIVEIKLEENKNYE